MNDDERANWRHRVITELTAKERETGKTILIWNEYKGYTYYSDAELVAKMEEHGIELESDTFVCAKCGRLSDEEHKFRCFSCNIKEMCEECIVQLPEHNMCKKCAGRWAHAGLKLTEIFREVLGGKLI